MFELQTGLDDLIKQFFVFHEEYAYLLDSGFLIFCRMLGLMMIDPVFGRKDVPFNIKSAFAILLTLILVWTLPHPDPSQVMPAAENVWQYMLLILMNVTVGLLLGFVAKTIIMTIHAAGSLMNNQMGLSSAMIFDASTRQQVAVMERLFGYIALMVLFHVEGQYWIIGALERSFDTFPLWQMQHSFYDEISFDYLVRISGNTLTIALQLVAPIFVVTMCVDLILGIVNRTAQQIQVFQLSFALKPSIALSVFLLTLPIFMQLLYNYLSDYAQLY